MKKTYVLVKSWGESQVYQVQVLGVSDDPDKLREILYNDVEPVLAPINEDAEKRYDREDWDGEPWEPFSPDAFFLDAGSKLHWFCDMGDGPAYDYEIYHTDVI